MKTLFIIQPVLASYRIDMINEVSKSYDRVVVYSVLNYGKGFDSPKAGNFISIHTPLLGSIGKLYYQFGIVTAIIKDRPTSVFMTADFRALNFWVILLLCSFLRIPVLSHGQGVYDKYNSKFIFLYRILFKIVTLLSRYYVCYTQSVKKSLIKLGINKDKLVVMDNTIINKFPFPPEYKNRIKFNSKQFDILYIGRLREGCNLELLMNAISSIENTNKLICLHVIGDGELKSRLKKIAVSMNFDVIFYGSIYDDNTITNISKKCIMGIYPGDAGLSLVHYMSLSLIPVVHSMEYKHMGPEASYIEEGLNGLLFKRNDLYSLAVSISSVLSGSVDILKIQRNAYNTYIRLSTPSMAYKLLSFLNHI